MYINSCSNPQIRFPPQMAFQAVVFGGGGVFPPSKAARRIIGAKALSVQTLSEYFTLMFLTKEMQELSQLNHTVAIKSISAEKVGKPTAEQLSMQCICKLSANIYSFCSVGRGLYTCRVKTQI